MKHNELYTIEDLQLRAAKLSLPDLKVFPKTVERGKKGYFLVMTECMHCGIRMKKDLRNMEKGYSRKCKCQNGKYDHDPRVKTLTHRYAAMVQRCRKDNHVSSDQYKGRQIECRFSSMEQFIRWALGRWPDTDFEGWDFDRIDNGGHYDPENLRLCTRRANLLNRRDSANAFRQQAADFKQTHPYVTYAMRTVWNLLQQRFTWEQIVARWKTNSTSGRRWKPVTNPLLSRSEIFATDVLPPASTKPPVAA